MKRFVALALLVAAPAIADTPLPPAAMADTQLPDPRQEAKAQALMDELRCVVCQGQAIADSDADMAGQLRAPVRERIAQGEDRKSSVLGQNGSDRVGLGW